MAKVYKQLKTELKLGASILTLKKQDATTTYELGVTTEDVTPVYTEETQYTENTTVTFGTTVVETLYSGEIITFVCSVALDDTTEEYLSDILQLTDQSKERNALINGIRATGFILNIHPISKKDNDSDINIVNCTCQVIPNRTYDTENNSYLALTFTAHPAKRPMDTIEDSNYSTTLATGGSLVADTALKYKVEALDQSFKGTLPTTETDITPTGATLTVDVAFNRVFGASKYRVWKSDDAGATWEYFDILNDSNVNTQEWSDDGSETFTAGTPTAVAAAKVYATVNYGEPLSDLTLESAD